MHAAFALDRFDDDGSGRFADRGARRFNIVEGDIIDSRQPFLKGLAILLRPGQRKRARRTPMERTLRRDDAIASA